MEGEKRDRGRREKSGVIHCLIAQFRAVESEETENPKIDDSCASTHSHLTFLLDSKHQFKLPCCDWPNALSCRVQGCVDCSRFVKQISCLNIIVIALPPQAVQKCYDVLCVGHTRPGPLRL